MILIYDSNWIKGAEKLERHFTTRFQFFYRVKKIANYFYKQVLQFFYLLIFFKLPAIERVKVILWFNSQSKTYLRKN